MKPETLNRVLAKYEETPHLVFWEMTKACPLACRHCRAVAQSDPMPGELTREEGMRLLEQVADMGKPSPILILTGGDCLSRTDLMAFVAYAHALGIRMGVAPSVSEQLTPEVMRALYAYGIKSVSISLDGADSIVHDDIRGIPGHFDQTVAALDWLKVMGFRLQVNTTVMDKTADQLADIASMLIQTGIHIWEVFFLIGVGRGSDMHEVTPQEAEDICHFLVDVAGYGMIVRTVEAPFFRRIQAHRLAMGSTCGGEPFAHGPLYSHLHERLVAKVGYAPTISKDTSLATGDGRGIIFVGHDGSVHASGFLPLPLGNIRQEALGEIYAKHPVLKNIRSGLLHGACETCMYRRMCGGSRARAYVHSGDVLGEDPSCILSMPVPSTI